MNSFGCWLLAAIFLVPSCSGFLIHETSSVRPIAVRLFPSREYGRFQSMALAMSTRNSKTSHCEFHSSSKIRKQIDFSSLKKKNNLFNGQEKEETVVILYYKPKGVITSHSKQDSVSLNNIKVQEQNGRITVYDDVMSMKGLINAENSNGRSFSQVTGIHSKLHAIGRLDVDTTGLLLLTNDGGLVHHVTNPNSSTALDQGKITKVYDALIMGYHTLDPDLETSTKLLELSKGVDIGKKYGGMTLPPNELKVLNHPSSKTTLVRIAISEGKNRQVRRMFHSIGSGVIQLHRRQVGNIDLDMLAFGSTNEVVEGSWRLLTKKEIMNGLNWIVRPLVDAKKQNIKSNNNRRRSGSKRRWR